NVSSFSGFMKIARTIARYILALLILAVLAAGIWVYWSNKLEPVYRGKTVSQWILEYPPISKTYPLPIIMSSKGVPLLMFKTDVTSTVFDTNTYRKTATPDISQLVFTEIEHSDSGLSKMAVSFDIPTSSRQGSRSN